MASEQAASYFTLPDSEDVVHVSTSNDHSLRRGLLAVVAALFCVAGFAGQADAAIYWGHSSVIGRANNDGSDALTKTSGFISTRVTPYIGRSCGVAVNDTHIYWADSEWGRIGRATLDGFFSELDFAFISGADEPCGVAVDDSHVYWANRGGNSIGRARLDGGGVDQGFVDGVNRPCGVAVDDDFVYWAGSAPSVVGRALLPGGDKGPALIEDPEGEATCGVAVSGEHLFWGGYDRSIGRIGIDGAEPDPNFIDDLVEPCALAVHDSRLFWGEGSTSGRISSAWLNGSDVDRGVVERIPFLNCGSVAVDSLGPLTPAPRPKPSPACVIEGAKLNKRKGIAFAALGAPAHGEIRVLSRGLHWRVLGEEPPPNVGGYKRWWIKLRPRVKGKVARRIKRQLKRRGRARVNLRIFCAEDGNPAPAFAKRRIALRKKKRRRAKGKAPAQRRSGGYRAAGGPARR